MAIRDLPDSYDAFEQFNVGLRARRTSRTRTPARRSPSRLAISAEAARSSTRCSTIHCSRRSACHAGALVQAPRRGGAARPRTRRPAAAATPQAAASHARSPPLLPQRVRARGARAGRKSLGNPGAQPDGRHTGGYACNARPRSSEDRAGAFEAPCGGSIPPGAATPRSPACLRRA